MVQSLNLSGIVNAFRVLWNPSLAMPHVIVEGKSLLYRKKVSDNLSASPKKDIRQINFANLKRLGQIKAIGFDKDNCLTAPYVSTIHPPFQEAWEECKSTFSKENVVIVSNSAGTADDKDGREAAKLEESLDVTVLRHQEKKPSGGKALADHMAPLPAHQIAFVGDRILTDVLFGNLNGNLTIWTRQVVTEQGDNKPAMMVKLYRLMSLYMGN
ncbi:Phosphatidylglycerophosphatase GEP4, mitochondrial [Choanephora cucurbitarum]|uniref:Phosphatidylglycerophosphatase GEP4, mitochondrial n=1 Tax=Choanephora cucurbitarum TaxID=101091 RepID=A0A1C7N898_9FUNG|nr:Phosphatidylglycerophosphatase GEP4, mitochondrial [Choanephora cucurbitarum]